ncbi:hypothetical protein [Fictibacillus sp. KU28468]|uniref:hypothetical protein n=1 Tax=Fictibacillus sp. KU28468 TaxID=2991053 RepID=UPI00223D92ED|nr:hypothetical protein [Fictibacillus sp. KU28468]UZJ77781.1 hypothetical protein OKX00_16645 [Fictibacillus sp. KU28468]
MDKIVKELNMGEHRIVIRESEDGVKTARLSSGFHGAILEVEKEKNGIRIKEMELGSAHLTAEHLALLLHHAGVSEEVMAELAKLQQRRVG